MRFVIVVLLAGCVGESGALRWHHVRAAEMATRDDDQPRRANVTNQQARALQARADPRVVIDLPP